jgi:hypothetical protein
MSNKGKTFTHADLPRGTQQRIKNKQVGEAELAKIDQWLADQTERNKVVAVTEDGTELIAEELTERSLRYWATDGEALVPEVLVQLRNLMTLSPDHRTLVLQAFDEMGDVINPFKAPSSKKAKK